MSKNPYSYYKDIYIYKLLYIYLLSYLSYEYNIS